MNFGEYQQFCNTTCTVKEEDILDYCLLGLCGETGEVAEKAKKIIRDKDRAWSSKDRDAVAKELGDVLWYLSMLAEWFGYSLEEIAQMNVDKLTLRKKRGVLGGSGDNR